jgi:predicted alpha/beta-fold hydrolase
MSISGHFWTIAPHVQRRLFPTPVTNAHDWSCLVPDTRCGAIRLHGKLSHPTAADLTRIGSELLIVIHGLGGSSESGYARHAANVANAARLSCLRLNQRGAELRGEDFYHAGLWQDLDVAIMEASLAQFDALYLLGYSIGGQLCLHWAAKAAVSRSRVRAVASVCAPLDLSRTAENLDSFGNSLYRSHVLSGLRKTYAAVAARRDVPVATDVANRISRMRDWDERITARHHGFESVDHYYASASANQCLQAVTCPTLMVVTESDPMVPMATIAPALHDVPSCMVIKRLANGGHVGFPADTSLDQPGPLGLEQQIITWLRAART